MSRGIKITLLGIAAVPLIVGFILLVVSELERPYFSPPDRPREWARQNYEDTFLHGHPAGGLPTLSTTAPLLIDTTREEGKIIVETEGSTGHSKDSFFEIFPADARGEILLPTGNRLKLEAVGIAMPEDVMEEDGPMSGAMVKVNWVDPVTLKPLPPEIGEEDGDSRKWISGRKPELFLRVSNEGGKEIRWLGVEAFDDRTLIQVQSGGSFRTHEKKGRFGMALETWHQAPLRIAVQFSFGDPEFREMELKPEAEVRFGDDALVRVVAISPVPFTSTGWSSHGSPAKNRSTFGYSVAPETGGRDQGRGVIFHMWPVYNERLIDFVVTEKGKQGESKRFINAWGNEGITTGEFPKDSKLISVQARRMPRLGRAVFLLPKVPRLPETDNLFETPITMVRLHYRSQMEETIYKGAAVQWSGGTSAGIPGSQFPMVLEDTTPGEVLKLYQELARRRMFFDRKKLKLSSERSGMLTDLAKWWRRSKPGWMP